MGLKDAAELIHFRELHLLPRTIFAIGAICFLGAFFLKQFLIGFLGVGIIFIALTLNFVIGVVRGTDISITRKTFQLAWMQFFQLLLCAAVTYKLLVLIYYFYRHGEMPPDLQPLANPH
ncbi:MAG: hypothetical protein ACRD5M_02720 [Candidatus Acidiferrales bacterium]